MRIAGCPLRLETIAQIELVHEWMAQRGVLTLDPRNEPFLLRKLKQLAPKPAIAREHAPRGAA